MNYRCTDCCETFRTDDDTEPDHCPLCEADARWLVASDDDGAEANP